jgi:hypothetical protein
MWTYFQRTGALLDQYQNRVCVGYAGKGEGKNNPEFQHVKNVGPLPAGVYLMTDIIKEGAKTGPMTIILKPHPENKMYRRSGFLIHGDSMAKPGEASEGCIIIPRVERLRLWESPDHLIWVVSGPPDVKPW